MEDDKCNRARYECLLSLVKLEVPLQGPRGLVKVVVEYMGLKL